MMKCDDGLEGGLLMVGMKGIEGRSRAMARCLQEHEWKSTKLEPLSRSLIFRVVVARGSVSHSSHRPSEQRPLSEPLISVCKTAMATWAFPPSTHF